MLDIDTFLTVLYVLVDDFCKGQYLPCARVGHPTKLTVSEVIVLAMVSQWYRFRSQRDFYTWAQRHLRGAFPHLPDRSQYNRQVRKHHFLIVAFFRWLCQELDVQDSPYEVLDTSGVPVRNAKRRGAGWLDGMAKVGWCTRLGWFIGFRLLAAVNRQGMLTGYGVAEGSAKEQPMSDSLIHYRQHPHPRLLQVGLPARGAYLADKGFASRAMHQRWRDQYRAIMLCQPNPNHTKPWPKPWRRWLHHHRQIVETAFQNLIDFFRLEKNRLHTIEGFLTDLAAKMALYNFCILLNRQHGRLPLAFADLIAW